MDYRKCSGSNFYFCCFCLVIVWSQIVRVSLVSLLLSFMGWFFGYFLNARGNDYQNKQIGEDCFHP
jgi:hypothetical protein